MAKILVVNDESDLVEIIEIVLREAGYEVKGCIEGLDAPAVARRYCPAVILLDWTLRETDGGRVLSSLRAGEATRSIPVIMMSASQDGAKLAEKAGADAFLPKPFEAYSLIDVVTAILTKSTGASAPVTAGQGSVLAD
jgi:DNA-binding response OmpR family regulator